MDIGKSLMAALIATTAIASPAPVVGQTFKVERFGLYVLADDIERSRAYYKQLFGRSPQVNTPALVGFDVAGGLFGIVSRETYAPTEPRAGSVRPYLKVADIKAAFDHVERLSPGRIEGNRIVSEGVFSYFRFSDPDGNVVEVFAVETPLRDVSEAE